MRTAPLGRAGLPIDSGPTPGSDGTFGPPAGVSWDVQCVSVYFVASDVVGDRRLALQVVVEDGSALTVAVAGAAQTAGQTLRYAFGPGLPSQEDFVAGCIAAACPPLEIPAGMALRVVDLAAVDPDGDAMTVSALGIQY